MVLTNDIWEQKTLPQRSFIVCYKRIQNITIRCHKWKTETINPNIWNEIFNDSFTLGWCSYQLNGWKKWLELPAAICLVGMKSLRTYLAKSSLVKKYLRGKDIRSNQCHYSVVAISWREVNVWVQARSKIMQYTLSYVL